MIELIEHPAGKCPHRRMPDGTLQYFQDGAWRYSPYCNSHCIKEYPLVALDATWAEAVVVS